MSIIVGSLVYGLCWASADITPALSRDALTRLGERLFFDARLSRDRAVSCATCHRPEVAFAEGRPKSLGTGGRIGLRNAPSLLDVGSQRTLFWDGRQVTLEAQAVEPLINPTEHGLGDHGEVVRILATSSDYPVEFKEAFGAGQPAISVRRVGQALAAYQRTLKTGPAPVDRFLRGDESALTPRARAGWQTFSGVAACIRCHTPDQRSSPGGRPLFTDHDFHAIGIGQERIARLLPVLVPTVARERAAGVSADKLILDNPEVASLGRFVVSADIADLGKFRTPGLRNVALTAPYMHDGSIRTLREAVDHEVYYRGRADGRPLILTPQELDDLVLFLEEALTTRQPPLRARSTRVKPR